MVSKPDRDTERIFEHCKRSVCHLYGVRILFVLVEMAGVEPASESALGGTSPGADSSLHSLAAP